MTVLSLPSRDVNTIVEGVPDSTQQRAAGRCPGPTVSWLDHDARKKLTAITMRRFRTEEHSGVRFQATGRPSTILYNGIDSQITDVNTIVEDARRRSRLAISEWGMLRWGRLPTGQAANPEIRA
jgi:hypothetical protein